MSEQTDGDGVTDQGGSSGPSNKVLGFPYDFRRPTKARAMSRLYNRDDPRLLPPKSFGVGWTINFYWVLHFVAYVKALIGPQRRS